MKITKNSHLDHGLTPAHIKWIEERFADREAFFIETVEMPEHLGSLNCGLRGPLVGDEKISEDDVTYVVREGRPGSSRTTSLTNLPSRQVSIIAGPHEDEACILFTAFGGPVAPREPFDSSLSGEELVESQKFWANHALSSD